MKVTVEERRGANLEIVPVEMRVQCPHEYGVASLLLPPPSWQAWFSGPYKTKHWQRTKVQKQTRMRHMMAVCLILVKLQRSGEKTAFSKIANGCAHGKV